MKNIKFKKNIELGQLDNEFDVRERKKWLRKTF